MKKSLIALSSNIGIILGITNTIINTQNNEKINLINKEQIRKYSVDISKYDLTNKPNENIQLNNLLQLFKEINQTRKENNSEISFNVLPSWNMISDDGNIFALGWLFQNITMLEELINLNLIEFNNIRMNISKDIIIVNLDYNIQDKFESLTILTFEDYFHKIPLKQEKMTTTFEFIYSEESWPKLN